MKAGIMIWSRLKSWEARMDRQYKDFTKEELKARARFRNKNLLKYALKLRWMLVFGFVITIISTLAELAGPYIISLILDENLSEGVGAINPRFFYSLVAIYFLSTIIVAIVRYVMNLSFAKLANGIAYIIRRDVFEHMLKLPVQFFDKYPAGKIVNRVTNDTQDIRMLFQILFFDLITTFIFGLGLIIGLFLIDPILGLVTLLSLPLAYIVMLDYKKKSTRYNTDMRTYRSAYNANFNESIQNMEIVQSFNNEELIFEEYDDLNTKHYQEGEKLSVLYGYSSHNATSSIGNLIITLALIYFGYSYLGGQAAFTVGGLYIFVDYNRKLYSYINNLLHRVGELEKAKSAADQVFELLEVPSYPVGDKELEELKGHIHFDQVSFAYNEDDYVLHDINLDIRPGQSVAFVGHTGSGKSTIMNLIYGFYPINHGLLTIDKIPIDQLNMEMARKQMAIVFQNPYIFEGSVYENIALFDESISKKNAELALIQVGGEGILMKNRGIDAYVQEGGGGFSSGEKQLISFARAMVRNPKILVLDEATANVDSQTEEFIQFGVNQLKKGRTTLIIAHRLSTIKDVDKIVVLENGRMIEEGDHQSLIEKQGVYAQMYKES